MLHVVSPTGLAVDSPPGRKLFEFDRVFGADVPQEGVWDYVNESVNAFVHGYNVSVLAYGQSGSGKSYTMGTSGPAEQSDPEVMGRCSSEVYGKRTISDPNAARSEWLTRQCSRCNSQGSCRSL